MDEGFAGPGGVGWALDYGKRGTGGRDDYSRMGGWNAGWEGGSCCHGVAGFGSKPECMLCCWERNNSWTTKGMVENKRVVRS